MIMAMPMPPAAHMVSMPLQVLAVAVSLQAVRLLRPEIIARIPDMSRRREALHDLATDPKQQKDLSRDPKHQRLLESLRAKLLAFEEGKR